MEKPIIDFFFIYLIFCFMFVTGENENTNVIFPLLSCSPLNKFTLLWQLLLRRIYGYI